MRGEVIDGEVVAVDGVPVCSHGDETRREFVPGRGTAGAVLPLRGRHRRTA